MLHAIHRGTLPRSLLQDEEVLMAAVFPRLGYLPEEAWSQVLAALRLPGSALDRGGLMAHWQGEGRAHRPSWADLGAALRPLARGSGAAARVAGDILLALDLAGVLGFSGFSAPAPLPGWAWRYASPDAAYFPCARVLRPAARRWGYAPRPYFSAGRFMSGPRWHYSDTDHG